jgi:hypothetical protein
MDLNYLFHRQQVEKSLAKAAGSAVVRRIHEQLAAEYERQIEELTAGRIRFVSGLPERVRKPE